MDTLNERLEREVHNSVMNKEINLIIQRLEYAKSQNLRDKVNSVEWAIGQAEGFVSYWDLFVENLDNVN